MPEPALSGAGRPVRRSTGRLPETERETRRHVGLPTAADDDFRFPPPWQRELASFFPVAAGALQGKLDENGIQCLIQFGETEQDPGIRGKGPTVRRRHFNLEPI